MSHRQFLQEKIKKFPVKPGVYLFYNQRKKLIYVGKATNLRTRTRSYFSGRVSSGRPIEKLIDEVADIKYRVTGSVLSAIILEANYIKKFQPRYNILGKDDKSWYYIVITRDAYPRVDFVRQRDLTMWRQVNNERWKNVADFFGPYPGLNVRAMASIFRKIFFISDCRPGQKRPCLYQEMNQCLGVCTGEISARDYRRKVITPFKKFLRGGEKTVMADARRAMRVATRAEDFEEAARLRDQIQFLRKITDVALLNKSFFSDELSCDGVKIKRLEAYDISNLGEQEKVGSMVVFDATGPVKAEYRKFKIKGVSGQSDVDCLREVLERRLRHQDWPTPEVILVDGGIPQVNVARKILADNHREVWLLGLAKGPARRKNEFILANKNPRFLSWVKENKNLLIQARDESHRFAVGYHRQLRDLAH